MGKKKKDGKIFTPKETADRMLHDILGWDNLKYESGHVYWPNARKHIIDNSCGDGAFLALIVDFYIHNTEHPEGLKVLETQDFMNYVKMLGKYKSGGYYTFSSKELENYLNWSYGKKKD